MTPITKILRTFLHRAVVLARPVAESRHGGLRVLLLFLIFICFQRFDSCQTNYLKMHRTDLRQIFRVGRITAVGDQSEVSFSIPQGTLPRQPISVGFIHATDSLTRAASGAAGRANVC